jgi:hypothetical protein
MLVAACLLLLLLYPTSLHHPWQHLFLRILGFLWIWA